jgi:hypothetical protein
MLSAWALSPKPKKDKMLACARNGTVDALNTTVKSNTGIKKELYVAKNGLKSADFGFLFLEVIRK